MHKAVQLESDLIDFSVKVIKFVKKIESKIPRSLSDQLIRSATSIGANYTEAINGSSKADFKNKIFISKKEASETRYWLKIIQELDIFEGIDELLDETQKFIMILQKTVNTLIGKGKMKK